VYESVEAVYRHAGDSTVLISAVVGGAQATDRQREERVGLNYLSN
jgi:hypothetical protein